jgi:hypothetical protein
MTTLISTKLRGDAEEVEFSGDARTAETMREAAMVIERMSKALRQAANFFELADGGGHYLRPRTREQYAHICRKADVS